MDPHANPNHAAPHDSAAAPGTTDEPLTMVAVALLIVIVAAICVLWFYAHWH